MAFMFVELTRLWDGIVFAVNVGHVQRVTPADKVRIFLEDHPLRGCFIHWSDGGPVTQVKESYDQVISMMKGDL